MSHIDMCELCVLRRWFRIISIMWIDFSDRVQTYHLTKIHDESFEYGCRTTDRVSACVFVYVCIGCIGVSVRLYENGKRGRWWQQKSYGNRKWILSPFMIMEQVTGQNICRKKNTHNVINRLQRMAKLKADRFFFRDWCTHLCLQISQYLFWKCKQKAFYWIRRY